jgi:hypothetical protein
MRVRQMSVDHVAARSFIERQMQYHLNGLALVDLKRTHLPDLQNES